MKKLIKKGIALFTAVCCLTGLPVAVRAEDGYGSSVILENPTITMNNLELRSSVSMDTLWQNTDGSKDFDFGPGSDNMEDAYFQFDYPETVKIDGIDLIGWWPKDQGLKNISIYYEKDGEWIPVMEEYEVPWKTSQGSNGATEDFANGEQLRIPFDQQIVTSKLKLQIHSAYHSWSDKICMRLIAPARARSEAEDQISSLIEELKAYADSVLTGELPGEFPDAAVEELNRAIENAKTLIVDPEVTDERIYEEIQTLEEAREIFLSQQAPYPEDMKKCAVTLENLTVISGKEAHLTDRQITTGAVLARSDQSIPGYLVFDFGEEEISLRKIQILADDPLKEGIKSASVEYFDGTEWKKLSETVQLGWKGGFERLEGRDIAADESVSAAKIRLAVEETYSEDGSFSIREIWAEGTVKANRESLDELVLRAQSLLESAKDQETWEVDMVKLKLISAANEDTLARADQQKMDFLYSELLAAVNQLDESLKDKLAPTMPEDVRVESVAEDSAVISFEPSVDNVEVAGYKIYAGDSIVADVSAPEDKDARVTVEIGGLADGTDYTFVIKAYDTSDNLSEGISVKLTTKAEVIPDPQPQPDPGSGSDPDTDDGSTGGEDKNPPDDKDPEESETPSVDDSQDPSSGSSDEPNQNVSGQPTQGTAAGLATGNAQTNTAGQAVKTGDNEQTPVLFIAILAAGAVVITTVYGGKRMGKSRKSGI